MMVTLRRFCYGEHGTFGSMLIGGIKLYTVECPWLDNRLSVSCIPEGEYLCLPRKFYRGDYDAIEVRDVPERSHILFHKANLPTDVKGCIGVGSELGAIGKQWAVLRSAQAFDVFMENYGDGFRLEIVGVHDFGRVA